MFVLIMILKSLNNEASSGTQRQLVGARRNKPSGKVIVAPILPLGLLRIASINFRWVPEDDNEVEQTFENK